MIGLFTGLHIAVGLFLILIVMLQGSKSEGLSGLFGGGGGATLFGTSAPTFLAKVTTVLGIIFMITSLSLSVVFSRRTPSVMEKSVMEEQGTGLGEEQPAVQGEEPARQEEGKTPSGADW